MIPTDVLEKLTKECNSADKSVREAAHEKLREAGGNIAENYFPILELEN